MDLRQSFVSGGADLTEFFQAFGLSLGPFLRVVRRARAIVTGVQVVLFLSGHWQLERERNPRALVMEVLCHTPGAAKALRAMLEQSRYSEYSDCRHNLGEWKRIAVEKRTCMVQGKLVQRVVHVIELPRSPVQTVLSRTYGSMAGTYITGGAKAASLFPHLTFVKRRCWLPHEVYSDKDRACVEDKYRGWKPLPPGLDVPEEISRPGRSIDDCLSWTLSFDPERGHLRSEKCSTMSSLSSFGVQHQPHARCVCV